MKNIDEYVKEKEERIQEYIRIQNHGQKIYWGNFIRSIRNDCKVKVDIKIFDEIDRVHYYTDRRRIFKEKLIEAGVEVTDK